MATEQVHTSRGRIIILNPSHNSKLIDTRALSRGLYEQVCCIFRGDLTNKVRTFRDESESAGLFAGGKKRKTLLCHSLRAAQSVRLFAYSLY